MVHIQEQVQEKLFFLGPDKYRSANEGFAFDEILNMKAVYTMGDHEIQLDMTV